MGCELDWSALDPIVELLGIDDVPLLVAHLRAIRSHTDRLREAAHG